jgi:hypothetical protein
LFSVNERFSSFAIGTRYALRTSFLIRRAAATELVLVLGGPTPTLHGPADSSVTEVLCRAFWGRTLFSPKLTKGVQSAHNCKISEPTQIGSQHNSGTGHRHQREVFLTPSRCKFQSSGTGHILDRPSSSQPVRPFPKTASQTRLPGSSSWHIPHRLMQAKEAPRPPEPFQERWGEEELLSRQHRHSRPRPPDAPIERDPLTARPTMAARPPLLALDRKRRDHSGLAGPVSLCRSAPEPA